MADTSPSIAERYEASMVLSGVGDAIGYNNGRWEFCRSGKTIHKEVKDMGGVENIAVKLPSFIVSDDTVMHLATAEALIEKNCGKKEDLYGVIARNYKNCMKDMQGRAPGDTSAGHAFRLRPSEPCGWQQPFNKYGGGCGAAMRAMCIGLRFPRPEDVGDLIAVGVESGRMTHHHPTGFLGSVTTALFTAYAIQGKPVREWGADLVALLPRVLQYVEEQGRFVEENREAWPYFLGKWENYLKLREITSGATDPVFPDQYGANERDKFYTSVSLKGWGGASGHDAPMIAYDAMLGSGEAWKELCMRGMFHGGDSDSTGVMAGAWYGAKYGYQGVPSCNYENVEYRERLVACGHELLKISGLDSGENVPPESSQDPQTV